MKDAAAISNLVSTGVADKDRVRREMQSVSCRLTAASNHTFEFRKNYIAGLLPENACGHTIGTDTGEIASIAIVPNTKQTEYAHQAEQCVNRPNWKPKVHTTDNCPAGIALWKFLVRGVNCQLGLFHFTYRITKTFNKESGTYKEALAALQKCMYYYEESDLENVKECLRVGTLGKVNGKLCPKDQIDSKAMSYREYIRIWMYDSGIIYSRLANWLFTYRDECDDKGEYLFTKDTSKTVMEQMKKTKWVVDTLTKDELYLAVQPTAKSRTRLKTYIGTRGTESKLEKGHHAIAHFANGGMRHTLADYLGMGGIALYNLRIRFRFKVAKMQPSDRAKIPVGFQKSPHFTNHLQLSYNNELGKQAGLIENVHKDVEIFQPDNGERFFYEYYVQHQERDEAGILHDDNNRCLCHQCGRGNPYRKRKQEWASQNDLQTQTTIAPVPTPTAALLTLEAAPPTLQPLPPALMQDPTAILPMQVTNMTLMASTTPASTNIGPYSMLLASDKKKKKRNRKKT